MSKYSYIFSLVLFTRYPKIVLKIYPITLTQFHDDGEKLASVCRDFFKQQSATFIAPSSSFALLCYRYFSVIR